MSRPNADGNGATVPVIVLGVGPTALGVARCLGKAGITQYLVAKSDDLAAFSRWTRKRVVEMPEPAGAGDLVSLLDRLGLERAVLIPCTDVWTQAVADIPAAVSERLATSAPPPSVTGLLIDKLQFAAELARLDLPHPVTVGVQSDADLDRPLDGFFLKPRHSQQFAQRYNRKAFIFEGREEARQAFHMMSEDGFSAVLQEYIPGPPTGHYFIDGFVTAGGSVTALFARRRIRMYPPDLGNSTLMISVPLDEVRQAADDLVRLLTGIGYRGIFSAEFEQDPRDQAFKLLEVNSRPWWYIEFASSCGVDVCRMAYRDALGLDVQRLDGYDVGRRCVFLPQDLRAYLTLRGTKELTLFGWLRSWLGARPTIFAWDDPLPGLMFPIVYLRGRRSRRRAAAR